MISLLCPKCEIIHKFHKVRDINQNLLKLTCPTCSHTFSATGDKLFQTMHAIQGEIEKLGSIECCYIVK